MKESVILIAIDWYGGFFLMEESHGKNSWYWDTEF